MNSLKIINEINSIKKKNRVVILAHNYQTGDIQDAADFVGDSLELSKKCVDIEADIIVFCGVKFMAETAKLLSPDKKVLLPVLEAGCEMADMANSETLIAMKKKYPKAAVVAYVNTTAEIKALSDICCTSANAVAVVNSVKSDEVIFVPDRNLADYAAKHTDKKIIPYQGFCYVHDQFNLRDIKKARADHPDAILFVHPESQSKVSDSADYVLSTGGMIRMAGELKKKSFIIGTEEGMIYRLKKLYPEKYFYPLRNEPKAICANMKKTGIEDLLNALRNNEYEIDVDRKTAEAARKSIQRMLSL